MATVSVLAVGCAKASQESKASPGAKAALAAVETKRPIDTKSARSIEIGPCLSGAPATDDQTYTLTLGPNFNLRHAVVTHGGHGQNGAKPIPGHKPTLLDVFTSAQGTTPSKWGTLRIELKDKNLHFRTDGYALRGGDDWAAYLLCGVEMDPTNKIDPRWLSVRLRRDPTYPSYTGFNIGLIVTDNQQSGYELPIFIDPIVDNDGIEIGP